MRRRWTCLFLRFITSAHCSKGISSRQEESLMLQTQTELARGLLLALSQQTNFEGRVDKRASGKVFFFSLLLFFYILYWSVVDEKSGVKITFMTHSALICFLFLSLTLTSNEIIKRSRKISKEFLSFFLFLFFCWSFPKFCAQFFLVGCFLFIMRLKIDEKCFSHT